MGGEPREVRMRVLLLSRYTRLGPSSRVRSYQFLPALREAGVEVEPAPLLGDGYIRHLYGGHGARPLAQVARGYAVRLRRLLAARRYDLLWIEKEALPWLPGPVERILLSFGTPYVLDYDDAIFHRYDQHPNAVVRWALGPKVATLVRGAAAVVAGNSYLGDYMRRAGARTVVELPSVVDVRRYEVRRSPERDHGEVRIGWIGNPGTSHYLQMVRQALAEVIRPGHVTFVTIGAADDAALEGIPHLARQWSEASEVRDLQELDVGIMPVPDRPLERGKCGYKIVQYMACGLPTVASPVGANKVIVDHARTGFLACCTAEWVQYLTRLAEDPTLRQRMGAGARSDCERHYSHDRVIPRLVELFEGVARRPVMRGA